MKKTVWSILLTLCMILSLLPFGAFAAGTVASGDYGDGLHWSLSSDGTLTITGAGAMPDYTGESLIMDENIDEQAPAPWLEHDRELRAIVIGEGITHVGDFTFMNDRKVTSVTLPSTLRSIGKVAFAEVPIEKLDLPEGLQSIGERAFMGCDLIKSIIIPASVTELGSGAFEGRRYVDTIKLLGPVKKLESHVFYGCRPTELFLTKATRTMAEDVFEPEVHVRHVFFDGTRARFEENTKNLHSFFYAYLHPNTDLTLEAHFADVPEGTWYSESVQWAAERSFTTGTSDTTFSPNATCTRAQIVTFLWRYCGSPEMKGVANPFEDVKESDYYYKAVLWALEKGVTTGTTGHTFSPNKTVTRAETVTFFWRMNSNESPEGRENDFVDVPPNAYYATAVDWAVYHGLTNGISEARFGPDLACTRAQIVTFLNRYIPNYSALVWMSEP